VPQKMDNMNNLFDQQLQKSNQLFIQGVCNKHEFIMVTQTTSMIKDGKTVTNKSTSWMQCKHCGMTLNNSTLG
jgi:hypothetical protein